MKVSWENDDHNLLIGWDYIFRIRDANGLKRLII